MLAVLEFAVHTRLTLNSQGSTFCLQSTGIKGVCHHALNYMGILSSQSFLNIFNFHLFSLLLFLLLETRSPTALSRLNHAIQLILCLCLSSTFFSETWFCPVANSWAQMVFFPHSLQPARTVSVGLSPDSRFISFQQWRSPYTEVHIYTCATSPFLI